VSQTLTATNVGLNAEASIITSAFSGIGGDAYPRLYFQIKVDLSKEVNAHRGEYIQAWSFGLLTGQLRIGSEVIADIKPYSVNSWLWGETKENKGPISRDLYLNIEIPLDTRRIEWIERNRSGKSFEASLHINLQVQIFGNNTFTPSFITGLIDSTYIVGQIPIVVPDTQWRDRVLTGIGYGKHFVIELPAISVDTCKTLEHSFTALNKAQRLFELGLYDDTAASCRIALDQFFESREDENGKKIPRLKKSWEVKLGAATHQWLESGLSAIKDATNKTHHSADNHFDRLGAQMLLMVTTALVSYAAQRYSAQQE